MRDAGLDNPAVVRHLPISGDDSRTEWRYCDRYGAPLLEVVKYRDSKSGKRKTAIRHRPHWFPESTPKVPAKADGWAWCQPDCGGGLLYRAQELHAVADTAPLATDEGATIEGERFGVHLNAAAVAALAVATLPPVLIVEGEKDVDRLHSLGFTATCNFNGGGKWSDFHTERMPSGRDVVIFADTDKPGVKHAATVAAALLVGHRGNGKARRVRIVTAEQLGFEVTESHGRDISDWLDADTKRGAADVQALIDAAVAPGVTVEGTDGRAVHLNAAAAAVLNGGGAAAAPAIKAAPTKKKSTQHGAYHAARSMEADLSTRAMFVAGRGWYYRSSETALWTLDAGRVMLGKVQNHPQREQCQRGLRSNAIMGELEGMLDVDGDLLDANDWLAGLPNGAGILDLQTGAVRPATEHDRVTMALGAVPESGVPALFLRVLGDTVSACDDPDATAHYIRWWARRALTGDCRAEAMLFLYGEKGTGKSIIAETLLHVLGSYGAAVSASNLVGEHHQHKEWLARLAGKRLVWVNEPTVGTWRTDLVLQMVSGEPMVANFMRQNSFQFRSRMKLVATGNDAPSAPPSSGYWRRIRQVGARHKPERPDDTLKAKLRDEAGQILQWLIDLPDGPTVGEADVPAEVRLAAQEAEAEQDPAGEWIKANLIADRKGTAISVEVYGRYCRVQPDGAAISKREFDRRMAKNFGPMQTARLPDTGKAAKVRRCSPVVQPLF